MAAILLRTFQSFTVKSTAMTQLSLPTQRILDQICSQQINFIQNRGAARKGKRIQRAREARARATKRKLAEAQNPKAKKQHKRSVNIDRSQLRIITERDLDESLPEAPEDDVFFHEKFRKKRYSFDEIIEFHRQTAHPEVMNVPDSLVTATIELNLKMKIKKKKYIEKIESTLCYPNVFQYAVRPRKIIALCKDKALQQAARDAGAMQAGDVDIAHLLKTNQLTHRDFDHIVCHTDYIEEFTSVKGMRAQPFFPNPGRGNIGDNIVELVRTFKDGIDYSLKKKPEEPGYGFIECHFGKLNMTNEQLRDNIICLFSSINRFKPLNLADGKQFFQRVSITTPHSREMFYLKFWELVDDYQDPDILKNQDEEENPRVAAQA